jgi:hypothetical protein
MNYLAASIPRNVRMSKLNHVPNSAVIGCWHVRDERGGFQVFDVVMLPEDEFNHAKNHMATITPMSMSPKASGAAPVTFSPRDTKEFDAPNAEAASAYFKKEFKLTT